MLFTRNSFIAVTTDNLPKIKKFWVEQLGCSIDQERPGEFLMVDAGGVRLCFDLPDGEVHRLPSNPDTVIGLHVESLESLLVVLNTFGIPILEGPKGTAGRRWLRVS